jgi:hypothetical protein
VLDRELSYRMPFERLQKLSRTMSRKAFAMSWRMAWVLLGGYAAGLALIIAYAQPIDAVMQQYGLPDLTPIAVLVLLLVLGIWALRRQGKGLMKQRADFDGMVRFREEQDGFRLATPEIEYFVKWHGISQMLLQPDGVVFSHGNLFFMVPNEAFRDIPERDELARDVFGRLNPAARARSEAFIRPVLDASAATAGS